MLMIYGLFVFSVESAPFNDRQRTTSWQWASNNRVGLTPAYQFIGKGEDTISINGTLMPEFSGGPLSLSLLKLLADSGKAYLLMGGNGNIFGYYFIEQITETASFFTRDGTPQKIEFSIELKRYDAGREMIGSLSPIIPLINNVF